jgi:hypothetical protein
MKRAFFYLFIFSLLATASCDIGTCGLNKDGFIKNSNTFFQEIKDKERAELDKNWESYDSKLESFVVECYDRYMDELNTEEKAAFWGGVVTYYLKRYRFNVVDALADENNATSVRILAELENEEWEEKDLEEVFNDLFKEDFEKLIEDIKEDVMSWKDKFEKIFKSEKEQ